LRPADPQSLAVRAEQAQDVLREIREEVAGVHVLALLRGQLNFEPIEHARAVAVEEATEELFREAIDDVFLPAIESDRSLMLPFWPMLRKEHRPLVACGGEADSFAILCAPSRSPGSHVRNPRQMAVEHSSHDSGVFGIERDFENGRSRRGKGEIAVAQVDAQQIAVAPRIKGPPRSCVAAIALS
jgi:hypothetical protein